MSCVYFAQEFPYPIGANRKRRHPSVHVLRARIGGPFEDGLIKLGCTAKHPRFRLLELANEFKRSFSFLGAIRGCFTDEERLHRQFRHLRSHATADNEWLADEWFCPERELTSFIASLPPIFPAHEFEIQERIARGRRLYFSEVPKRCAA